MGKWEMVRLGEVANINMGQSPASETYNDIGKGLPFFQGKTDFQSMYPTIRMFCSAPQKTANKNDILMSVRAPVGAVNIATQSCCIGRGLAAISETENVSYYGYLFYYLRYKENDIANMGVGSTFKAISRKDISMFSIPLPPLDVQRKIADVLDKVSALIELRKAQLDKLDLLIKSQFVEMFGDPVTNPNRFNTIRLANVSDIVSGITKGRKTKETDLKEVPYMAVSNVKNGYIDWTTVKTIAATRAEIDRYRLSPDDILMTEGGDPDKVGRGAIIHQPLQDCIHQNHIFRVRLDESVVLPAYFAEYLQHTKAKKYFLECAKQTTGIASINMRQLKSLPVLLPSIKHQNKFAAFVEHVENQKEILQQSLSKLELNYKSLMQKCFRGEIF